MVSSWSQQFFYLANFSKLFLVSASDCCHQINFDVSQMLVKPDTLSDNIRAYVTTIKLCFSGTSKLTIKIVKAMTFLGNTKRFPKVILSTLSHSSNTRIKRNIYIYPNISFLYILIDLQVSSNPNFFSQ